MASHDLSFDVSHNGVQQPPSHDQQMAMSGAMSGSMDGGNMGVPGGAGGSAGMMERLQTESAHPIACIFHCLFKIAAIFLYMFGGVLTGGSNAKFITLAVFCILLLAADFWVVKNITGRLLVGLRWWNKVEGDTTRWIYESADTLPNGTTIQRNKFDSNVFWTVLYVTPLFWAILFFIGVLKFELGWLTIVAMALGLNLANVYGYYKCSKDQAARFQQMMQQGAQSGAMAMVRSSFLGALTGTRPPASGSNTYV